MRASTDTGRTGCSKQAFAMAALLVAAPASAQVAPAPAAASVPAAPVDPARLAEARLVVAKLLPPGVYRTVMGSSMAPVIDTMGDSLKALPLRQVAAMGGLDAEQAAALDKVDVEQVLAIYDPQWRERSRLTMQAMFDAMGGFFTTLEPELREAYAHAYANRFTLAELRELASFYATPTGAKFATQYLTIATDPAISGEMRAIMPRMMKEVPTFLAAAQKATAALPPPRKLQDLTPTERARLARALGVSEDKLKNPKSET